MFQDDDCGGCDVGGEQPARRAGQPQVPLGLRRLITIAWECKPTVSARRYASIPRFQGTSALAVKLVRSHSWFRISCTERRPHAGDYLRSADLIVLHRLPA
eukprot:3418093-Rhodomonas_salina.3